MNLLLLIITAVPLVAGLVSGIRRARPTLMITSLGLLVYFVIAPTYANFSGLMIAGWSPTLAKAQFLALLWSCIFVGVSTWYSRRRGRAESEDALVITVHDGYYLTAPVRPVLEPNSMLIAAAVLTVLGFAASATFGILGGGNAWMRTGYNQFAGMGFLAILGSNVMLFPLVTWYLFLCGHRVAAPVLMFAAISFLVVAQSFLYSGVTGGPVTFLMPFGILWCMRGPRVSVPRFLIVAATGYAAVWVLRFMRLVGQLTVGGRFEADLGEVGEIFANSNLRPGASFGEFFWFARVVEYIDGGGQTMGGKSYLVTITQFVPALVWPGKAEFLARARVDAFVRDVVLDGRYGGLIPVGAYGEAYLNYGVLALVAAAALIGLTSGAIDSRYRSSLWRIPGPLACAMFCSVLIVTCRGASQYLLTAAAPIVLFALASRLLAPLGQRSLSGGELEERPAVLPHSAQE